MEYLLQGTPAVFAVSLLFLPVPFLSCSSARPFPTWPASELRRSCRVSHCSGCDFQFWKSLVSATGTRSNQGCFVRYVGFILVRLFFMFSNFYPIRFKQQYDTLCPWGVVNASHVDAFSVWSWARKILVVDYKPIDLKAPMLPHNLLSLPLG